MSALIEALVTSIVPAVPPARVRVSPDAVVIEEAIAVPPPLACRPASVATGGVPALFLVRLPVVSRYRAAPSSLAVKVPSLAMMTSCLVVPIVTVAEVVSPADGFR